MCAFLTCCRITSSLFCFSNNYLTTHRETLTKAHGARPSTDAMADLYDRFKREKKIDEMVEGCAGGALCGLCLACTCYSAQAGHIQGVEVADASLCMSGICCDTAAVCCCVRCAPSAADTIEFQIWLQKNPDLVVRAGLIAAEEEITQVMTTDVLSKLQEQHAAGGKTAA